MEFFSTRNRVISTNPNGLRSTSMELRERIWNVFYKEEYELLKCDKFEISVAFITLGGVTPLLQTLKELEQKGILGEILTSNYLDFSEPLALKKLHSLSNVQIKMYDTKAAHNGFHTKGYIFREEEVYRIIIGSSNMTSGALTTNREWNTKLVSTTQGEMAEDILREFDGLWNSQYAYD